MPATEEEKGVGQEVIEVDEEDVEQIKSAPDPKLPSPDVVEQHRCIHIPFRDWCKWCVMGRGRGLQHASRTLASHIAIVGLDYFFITRGGVMARKDIDYTTDAVGEAKLAKDREANRIIKCVVIRCLKTKVLFAHVVPYKGAGEDQYVSSLVVSDIEWLGHVKLILKSDNEPALRTLVAQSLERARIQCHGVESISQEHPSAYESQSNGGVEIGVQLVRGLFRTLKLCLEARIGKYVPVEHALVPWLLEHTCLLLNVRVKGPDGLTPWARVKGRAFNQRLLGYGERILYKLPVKGPSSQPDGNMGTRWADAVFLGYHRSSNSYIVGHDNGVTMSRSIVRRPVENRWCAETLSGIKATPWSLYERPEPEVRFREPTDQTTGDEPRTASLPSLRAMRINKKDLDKYGYTVECRQCRHIEEYGVIKQGTTHSDGCRLRLVDAMKQDPVDCQRVEKFDERINRNIAERIRHADQTPAGSAGRDEQQPRGPGGEVAPAGHAERPHRDHRDAELELPQRAASAGPREVLRGPARSSSQGGPAGVQTGAQSSRMTNAEAAAEFSRFIDPSPDYEGVNIEVDEPSDEQADDAMSMGFLGSLQPAPDDEISLMILRDLGSSKYARPRENRRACRRLLSEIYSPPRVTAELTRTRNQEVLPGFALDLTVIDPDDGLPWDFNSLAKREKAMKMVRDQRPYMLIGSPMCTAFCAWQALNAARSTDRSRMKLAYDRAVRHIEFTVELYREQHQGGRLFLHEQPQSATSWNLRCLKSLAEIPGVGRVVGDQCQFGAEVKNGKLRGSPVKKPTGFLSNSAEVLRALSRRCTGQSGECSRPRGGHHALCSGQIAKDAAIYPRGLCRAIIEGVALQMRADGIIKNGCLGMQAKDDDNEIAVNCQGPEQGYSGKYRDDLTGQVLKDSLVLEARLTELAFFHSKGVWAKRPMDRSRQCTGKPPITVRWVDVNKGDEVSPKYRSRLVARQMKAHDHSGASYFAPAPPLEALRTVLSLAVTSIGDHVPILDPGSRMRSQVSFIDISRAYFNAKIDERDAPTFVRLPEEDPDSATMCAQLLRHMYGTRMAADGWQEEYSTFLISIGFTQGVGHANLFRHAKRGLKCSVHGDDFTTSGPCAELNWFEETMGQHYEMTIGPRLGPGPNDAKEARALNRIVRWTDEGIEYEADPRQSEKLVSECGLESSNTISTPGIRQTAKEIAEDQPLPARLHTAFRGAAARGNYLSADRPDAQFACKEVCRFMSSPSSDSWTALKRICRFLNGRPRLVYVYPRQQVDRIDVYVDTDWAGCPRTRKSTSGGCVMLGAHAVKHWSSTQASTALSSGEAEFNGVVRGSGQGLGYQSLLHDLGVDVPLRVWTDSSAAIGICSRQGLGKLRHLDTHTLWVQQAVRTGRVDLRKVPGEENPADLFTKHSLSSARMAALVELHGCRYMEGRAESAPMARKGASSKFTMADAALQVADELRPLRWMPHIHLTPAELERCHPPLDVPSEEELPDLLVELNDSADDTLKRGLAIASEIASSMQSAGRRRYGEPG